MKLRINGNSIRIRLSRTEVERLGEDGYLEEHTEFGGSTLAYALQSRQGISGLQAGFENGKITMYIPAGLPTPWATNDIVGYNNTIQLGNGRQLYLLLEKDFKCIDNTMNEDQSDNYPNPHETC